LLQVSKALSRAHEAGIVHRDLKPDNVFLVRDGDDEIAKVLDFGIAKRTGALQTSSDMATRTGSLMGTPYYMSPEQASGRRQVDHRTDIWAFAVIAYECITGQRPFDDTNLGGLLLSICTEPPAPASSILPLPPEFDAWFARCTAKDPAARYETIREAANDLCRAVGLAMPTSRLAMQSHPDGTVSQGSPLVVKAVTGPWEGSRSGGSAATPGAVIVTTAGATAATLARPNKKRPPILLLTTGAIGALGLLSAVVALVWRSVTPAGDAAAARVASESVPLTTAAIAPAPALVASVVPSALAAPVQLSVVPASSASAAPAASSAAKARGAAPAAIPRQPLRRLPERTEPTNTGRLRPQDRLERDLGF
jgi:eukaryotic-like serine/threonine-protein kinase